MNRFRLASIVLFLTSCCASFPAQGNQKAVQIWTSGFGPTKDVRVRTPRFVWQVWPDGDAHITGSTMLINGRKVNANYDEKKRELSYESAEPLAPGTYEVLAKVKVDNWANFEKKWSVKISSETISPNATISPDAMAAIAEYNRIRKAHGFEPCQLDNGFAMSAAAHTNYLFLNREGGHYEQEGKPGFTGTEPADRVSLFGHVGSSFEVVSMGGRSAADGVRGLWDAPYHRISMMKPGPGIVGASFKDQFFTMDGDGTSVDGTFVSPPDGGQLVPVLWHNREVPDPTRNFDDATKDLGYPIVMNVYGKDIKELKILESHVTTNAGKEIPKYELSSKNDENLHNSVILIPKKPLASGTTYSVTLKVQDNNGKIYDKAWKFTTQ